LNSIVLKFGLLACAIFILVEIGRFSLITQNNLSELLITIVSALLLTLGFFLGRYLLHKEYKVNTVDKRQIEKFGLSARELEVLQKISEGKSNQEIANSLFIAETTVKTHVSNILMKLDVRRRTEAVNLAFKKNLISDYRTT